MNIYIHIFHFMKIFCLCTKTLVILVYFLLFLLNHLFKLINQKKKYARGKR